MAEKRIELQEIDPVEIFGVNDKLLNRLSGYFTKLKVVARGNVISLKGTQKDIAQFESAIESLIAKRYKKRSLNIDDIDSLFDKDNNTEGEALSTMRGNLEMTPDGLVGYSNNNASNSDIIVYGNDGKNIRARTKNQKKLVAEYYKHDLIFALGPAGTGKTYTAIALAVRALKNR